MSVGVHFTKADWNNKAYTLYSRYKEFCALAAELSATLAPLSDQNVIDATGFTAGEVADLKSGCNVANALKLLSEGSTDGTVLTQSRQVSSLVGKFGGA